MRFLRLAIATVFALAFGKAYAFHSGGVAECEGCHTMHNSVDGVSAMANENTGLEYGTVLQAGPYLLKSSTQSGACLNCHNAADSSPSSYHVSTDDSKLGPGLAPVEMTPGGDFAWLKKSYTFLLRGSPSVDEGDNHGHNIIAPDYNYFQDKARATAPGGTYPAANLQCSSCHDPHGQYRRLADGSIARTGLPIFGSGSYPSGQGTAFPQATQNGPTYPQANKSAAGVYRLLAGKNYLPKSVDGSTSPFTADPPAAVVPSSYNRSEATQQTHVAYGKGMSEWCANCHSGIIDTTFASGLPNHRHPAGNNTAALLKSAQVQAYNTYVSSGIMTNADPKKAYSSLVPFELGTADYDLLATLARNDDTVDHSATPTSNVMCLSCHRAHASGFAHMVRYNLENEFMTIADQTGAAQYDASTTEGKINLGKNVAEQTAAYYGRPASAFGPYARNLCNKCHAKD